MPWHIDELRRIGEPESGIFRYVCRNACMIPTQLLITVDDVVRLRTQAKLTDLAKSTAQNKEWQEAVDDILKEKNDEIADRNEQLRLVADSQKALRDKFDELREENRILKQNLKTVYGHKGEPLPDVARDSLADILEVCANVGEIAEWVADEYKDRIIFLPPAMKDAKNSRFERLEECAAALRTLAPLYWAMQTGRDTTLAEFTTALAERSIEYSPKISQVTAGRYGKEYERRYRNRKADLNKHLKLGDAFDPRYTLRIHFEWDNDDELVVINYCGWHPKTRS